MYLLMFSCASFTWNYLHIHTYICLYISEYHYLNATEYNISPDLKICQIYFELMFPLFQCKMKVVGGRVQFVQKMLISDSE